MYSPTIEPTGRVFNILPNVEFTYKEDKHRIPDRWDYECCSQGYRWNIPKRCLCGSDRRYEHCCWRAEDIMIATMPELWRLKVVEQYIIDELFNYFTCFMRAKEHGLKLFSPYFYHFFKEKYGVTLFSSYNKKDFLSTLMEPEKTIFDTAWSDFMLYTDNKADIAVALKKSDDFKLFRSWMMYNWIPNFPDERYSSLNGRPLVTTYMKDRESINPSCISSKEGRDFINMAVRAPYSFWSVEAVRRKTLTLKDLIYSGQTITVPEVRINFDVELGDVIYCKVVRHGRVHIICDSGAVFNAEMVEAVVKANIKNLPIEDQDRVKRTLFHHGTRKKPRMLRRGYIVSVYTHY